MEDAELLERRIVLLEGMIDDDAAAQIIGRLLYLERADSSLPIELHVNSPGGGVPASFAIIDAMADLRPPVHTLCSGQAQGMAAVILASGRKGERRASRKARIAFTPLRVEREIPPAEREIYAKEMERILGMLVSHVTTMTGQSDDVLRADLEQGRWFTPAEAKEYHLIDEILP